MTYLLAIGTKKGLFFASSQDRHSWQLDGPVRLGADDSTLLSGVYAVGIDTSRKPPRLFASADSSHYGPSVWRSDDLGATWNEPAEHPPIAFPADTDTALTRVWQFEFGLDGTVYAGAEPHSLWTSRDGGENFSLNRGLWEHPHHANWFPGFGGGAVHTVLPHPKQPSEVTVAMSTGGCYQTRDGGESWSPSNRGVGADFLPGEEPEYGQCVHKVSRSPADSRRMYLQNHGGVYRSDDEGARWQAIDADLPYDFGFGIVAHPQHADSVLNFPVRADGNRFLPDDRLQVFRSDDAGASWRSVSEGLPTDPYYAIVLRDAATTDGEEVPGFYFGTRCGDVYSTTEDSSRWHQVAAHLPDVLCVRAAKV